MYDLLKAVLTGPRYAIQIFSFLQIPSNPNRLSKVNVSISSACASQAGATNK